MEKAYLKEKGRLFDIQKFSVHDGPGIRTLVFLKGCLFRCKWCCNPESQAYPVETMVFNGKNKEIGKDCTVEEVLKEIEKDRIYYNRSGGGVTLSGGECLCQPRFAKALLHACKESGIATAIETTAGVSREVVESILPVVDLVMMDIKHMDGQKHKAFTGKDNKTVLENARIIAQSGVELIVRVPIIPGFNDQVADIASIAQFVKSLETVQEIHLLPYHRMGQDKYEGLGRVYELKELVPPTESHMQELLQAVVREGLKGQIGG
ncbi:MAG: glycyl-radical enzyme activating protein [Cellulosilyticaceae bacterium]